MAEKLEKLDHFYLRKLIPDAHAFLNAKTPKPSLLNSDCLFAFDANAIITLYKVGNQANIGKVLRTLSQKERIFVPEHALREALKNRTSAVATTTQEIHKQISENHGGKVPDVPMLSEDEHYLNAKKQSELIAENRRQFRRSIDKMKAELRDWGWNDPITKLLCEVFTPSAIIKCSKSDSEVLADLEWRFKLNIPPGFKDAKKPDGGIGDVIIWNTLLELGKSAQKSIVFVSNDEKGDWMVRENEDAIIARGELTAEFYAETGQHFAIINLSRFLELNNADVHAIEVVKVAEQNVFRQKTFFRISPIGSSVLREIRSALADAYSSCDHPLVALQLLKYHKTQELISNFTSKVASAIIDGGGGESSRPTSRTLKRASELREILAAYEKLLQVDQLNMSNYDFLMALIRQYLK